MKFYILGFTEEDENYIGDFVELYDEGDDLIQYEEFLEVDEADEYVEIVKYEGVRVLQKELMKKEPWFFKK